MKNLFTIAIIVFSINAFAQILSEQKIASGLSGIFGTSISISKNLAVVSAGWENTSQGSNSGAVYVYDYNGSEWIQKQRITSPNGSSGNIFGLTVATNGKYIVITEPNAHKAHIYTIVNSVWSLDTSFQVSNVSNEEYGISCAIDENTVVIGSGAIFANYCNAVGSVYVYENNGTEWINTTILTPSNGLAHDNFGASVSIDANYISVGADRGECYSSSQGYVSIFEKDASAWIEKKKLFAPDGTDGNRFGASISLNNNQLIVSTNGVGASYYFERNTDWAFKQKLTSSDVSGNDGFGGPVCLNNNLALIGATGFSGSFSNQGAAYLFEFNGTTWNQKLKILPSDPAIGAIFGNALCLYDNFIFVAAGNDLNAKLNTYAFTSPACFMTIYDTIPVYTDITVTDTLIIKANFLGYNPVAYANTIKVYPNPTKDKIAIDCGNNFSTLNGYSIEITNSLSQIVYTSKVTQQLATINLSTWTGRGIYFVHLIDGNGSTVDIKKIVLQ